MVYDTDLIRNVGAYLRENALANLQGIVYKFKVTTEEAKEIVRIIEISGDL